jgi:hypothetical protein
MKCVDVLLTIFPLEGRHLILEIGPVLLSAHTPPEVLVRNRIGVPCEYSCFPLPGAIQ